VNVFTFVTFYHFLNDLDIYDEEIFFFDAENLIAILQTFIESEYSMF